MAGTKEFKAAQARIEQPADPGLMLQRLMRLSEGALDQLEAEVVEFQAEKKGLPRGYLENLASAAKLLNDVTLAHARYRKSEKEWADNLSNEEKLEGTRAFLLALHKDQPDLVRKWLSTTALEVNHATNALLGLQKPRSARRPDDQDVFEALDPGDAAWGD